MKISDVQRINVVLFWFMNDWAKCGRAYEKIAENLSNQNPVQRVICMLPPEKTRRRYRVLPFIFKKISKKLIVLTPNLRVIPTRFTQRQIWGKINEHVIRFSIVNFLKICSYNEFNTVLWIFPPHPYINNLIRWIPRKAFITQIVDNNIFKEHEPKAWIELVKKQYEELTKDSDIVITASKLNYEYFSHLNPNCYLFENAVDPVFLGDPSDFPCLVNNTKPRLGYAGWISERTDINLLRYLAIKRPENDIIIAGPIEISQEEFKKILLPNIHYEGIIPYKKMPAFLKSLDVCLIPHHDTKFSQSMSPLKMFQYLASGRPVVSTN